ncbi:hypothetical protein [Nocardia sp. alder85J]|uniref:hypothetical protein n=1 Tax=Nocardia sp. alder85J TaxID=2862949 RepID=UPI001CD7E547|nr:hypothetical protein [Nocardia sp. alder85J]MCX4090788.1 hypothetical protein [Nocardia sp. alder85J]
MYSISRATAIATLAIAATAGAMGVASAAPAESPVPILASTAGETGPAPVADQGHPDAAPAPVIPEVEYDKAVGALTGAFNNANHDGTLFGTAAGVVIGCPLGAITGGTLTALVSAGALTPVGVVGGCILGGVTLGGLGGTFAGAITGFPALADAAGQQYGHLHSEGLISAPLTTNQ